MSVGQLPATWHTGAKPQRRPMLLSLLAMRLPWLSPIFSLPSTLPPQPLPSPPAPCQQQHLGPTQPFAQELLHNLPDDEGAHEGVLICTEKEGWLQVVAWTASQSSHPQVGRRSGIAGCLEGLPGDGNRGRGRLEEDESGTQGCAGGPPRGTPRSEEPTPPGPGQPWTSQVLGASTLEYTIEGLEGITRLNFCISPEVLSSLPCLCGGRGEVKGVGKVGEGRHGTHSSQTWMKPHSTHRWSSRG